MDNNPVVAGSSGSSGHNTLHTISDYISYLTQTQYSTQEDYLDGRASGVAGTELAANGGAATTTLAVATDEGGGTEKSRLESMTDAEILEYFESFFSATPSPPEVSYVNPWDLVKDPSRAIWPPSSKGTPSVDGNHTSSESIGSVSAEIHAPDLEGEDPEVEAEPPFLLEAPSRSFNDDVATLIEEGDLYDLEEGENGGDVGKEGVEESNTISVKQTSIIVSKTLRPARSALMANPSLSPLDTKGRDDGLEGSGAASAPTGDAPCPGLPGRNAAEKKASFVELLEIADEGGAETRRLGLGLMSINGKTQSCTTCGKVDRRDRLLAHIVYKHLGFKTWACPLCQKDYATRDDLAHHLKAVKVLCLCGKDITRNNWYHHSRACVAYKGCLPLAGRPRLEKGILMMEQQQPTTAQAAPSLPSTTSEEENGGDQARPPRAQRQRPAARKAAKKRKALEFDDESGDEIEKERKTKRVKRDRT